MITLDTGLKLCYQIGDDGGSNDRKALLLNTLWTIGYYNPEWSKMVEALTKFFRSLRYHQAERKMAELLENGVLVVSTHPTLRVVLKADQLVELKKHFKLGKGN